MTTTSINVNNIPSQIGTTATRTHLGAACGPDGDDDAWSHFNGLIDDVGIWNKALTQQEIQNLFDNSFCNNLISLSDTTICQYSELNINSDNQTVFNPEQLNECTQPIINSSNSFNWKYSFSYQDRIYQVVDYSKIYMWNNESNQWDFISENSLVSTPSQVTDYVAIEVNNKVYIMGGYSPGAIMQSAVFSFNLIDNTWESQASLITPRAACGIAAKNEFIYLIGGIDYVTFLNTLHRYNTITNSWEVLPNMFQARERVGCAIIGNKLYATGGNVTYGFGFLNNVEVFDIDSQIWSQVIAMPEACDGERNTLAYNNKLYVIGGRIQVNGTITNSDKIKVFDPLSNSWNIWCEDVNLNSQLSNSLALTNQIIHTSSPLLIINTEATDLTYLWSTGETTPSITVSPTETTTYTLTLSQGSETCTDQVTVTVLPSPTVETTSNSPVIAGANLELNASASSGTTFLWTGPNNFTSTEQNPIVTNTSAFNAGIYSVTPTLNGCLGETVSLNIEIIPSDNVLTLYMDTVAGINGQETLVNMRVRNFTNMLSAQFTLQFDPSVVSYLGFTNPAVSSITGNSFGQIQIDNGILTFAWSQPNVIPVSLSDGTVLFSLRFQAVGSGGTSTPLQFVNTPTPLEFVDQSFIPLNSWIVNPGRIEILNLATISGSLTLPNGVGIRSATISASGFSNQSTQSALDGSYSINLAEGQSYSITPSKGNDTLVANGITTLDVILIQRHILGTLLLNSPFKIIAADVNLSGTITSADINLINALILANINQYPSGLFWSFVPDDYSFPNPVNPFPFPSSRNYPSLSGTVNENHIGVKLGDVNYTYNNALARLSAVTDSVSLFIEDQIVQEGSTINVPIKVKNFSNMAGFQLALEWDPQVISFNEVNSNNGGLAVNIGATQANSGLLNINWIEPNSSVATIQDDSALFVVTFEVIGEVGTNSAINIVSSPTAPIELINEILEVANYGIGNGNILVNIPSGITNYFENTITVFPNPASNFIQINCESCIQENKYTVHLYNSIGQLAHKQEIVSFPATISIENSMSTGLYFLMIEERGSGSGSRFVKKVQIKNH